MLRKKSTKQKRVARKSNKKVARKSNKQNQTTGVNKPKKIKTESTDNVSVINLSNVGPLEAWADEAQARPFNRTRKAWADEARAGEAWAGAWPGPFNEPRQAQAGEAQANNLNDNGIGSVSTVEYHNSEEEVENVGNRIKNSILSLETEPHPACLKETNCHITAHRGIREIARRAGYILIDLPDIERTDNFDDIVEILNRMLHVPGHHMISFVSYGHHWTLETKRGQFRILSSSQLEHSFYEYMKNPIFEYRDFVDESGLDKFIDILSKFSSRDIELAEEANMELFGGRYRPPGNPGHIFDLTLEGIWEVTNSPSIQFENWLRESNETCPIGTECHIAMGLLRSKLVEFGYKLRATVENVVVIEDIIDLLKEALRIDSHHIFFFTSFGHYWALETKDGLFRILSLWSGKHSFSNYTRTPYGEFQPPRPEFYNTLRELSSKHISRIEAANMELFGTNSGLPPFLPFPLTMLTDYIIT